MRELAPAGLMVFVTAPVPANPMQTIQFVAHPSASPETSKQIPSALPEVVRPLLPMIAPSIVVKTPPALPAAPPTAIATVKTMRGATAINAPIKNTTAMPATAVHNAHLVNAWMGFAAKTPASEIAWAAATH